LGPKERASLSLQALLLFGSKRYSETAVQSVHQTTAQTMNGFVCLQKKIEMENPDPDFVQGSNR